MKTLRLLRNLALLFILVMALPGLGLSRQERNKGCTVFSPGSNCSSNPNGDCTTSKCKVGQPCSNSECGKNPF